jgi:hypothetical protein
MAQPQAQQTNRYSYLRCQSATSRAFGDKSIFPKVSKDMFGKTYDTFAEWLAAHPEPSLQELVERYGGYSRVPPEAWAEFDRRMLARRVSTTASR